MGKKGKSKTVRIGVIGAGGISHAHVAGYRANAGVEIVAVADVMAPRAEEWAKRYGVSHWFEDYHKLLEMDELDAVSICTFNRAHAQPAVDALRAGKHVFCEKPMSDNLQDATRMLRAARQSRRVLCIGVHSRYDPAQRQAKRIVSEGTLGEVYYAETCQTRRHGNPGGTFQQKGTAGLGAVADIGVYNLDTALDVLGFPKPVSVSAVIQDRLCRQGPPMNATWQYDPKKFEVEEFGVAWIRLKTGGTLVFKVSWAAHILTLGRTYFLGTKAGLALDPLELFRNEFGMMTNTQPSSLPQVDRWKLQMGAFLDAVREGKPSPVPAEQVVLTNVIFDAMFRSAARGGKEVPVRLPEPLS
ncbi:MAG: Gfo/Idh/MocA family oxidoreductase [Planctomycetes bacterium]|nr:Gfo/Idh/MocA family oxidoreductase [Planctomycetota bacterium]